jgi:hypothetical protein
MVGRNGDTVESVRELIAVPPETERTLRSLYLPASRGRLGIERVLQYRRRVAEEFERLAADVSADRRYLMGRPVS